MERGTVVADRYVVSEVVRPWLAEFPDIGSVCLVLDAILDQPAILYTADASRSGDLLDAARRSALLTDPRIPGIHDVGRFEDIEYVVCERTGAKGLPELLAHGPLDPEAARAVVGELATALVHASKRGLHHLCLGPESVGLNAEGDVVVHGVAIDAAVADEPYELGLDSLSDRDSLREDALAIVNILYACLTGHWPGDEPRAGIPVAPRKNNRFVRADAITPGIPRELEDFVSAIVTKTEPGPRSPSEIVRYLGQWDTRALSRIAQTAVSLDEALRDDQAQFTVTPAEKLSTTAPTGNLDRTAGARPQRKTERPAVPDETTRPTRRATPQQLQAALTRIGMTRPGTHGLAAGVADGNRAPFDERMQMRQATTFPISAESLVEASEDTPQWQPEEMYSSYSEYASREVDSNRTQPIMTRDQAEQWKRAEQSLRAEDTQAIELGQSDSAAAGHSDENEDAEDDGSWFLGGMFTTREDEIARQRAEYERELQLQRQAEENARRSLEAARARSRADVTAGPDVPTQQLPAGGNPEQPGAGSGAGGAADVDRGTGSTAGGAAGADSGSAKTAGSAVTVKPAVSTQPTAGIRHQARAGATSPGSSRGSTAARATAGAATAAAGVGTAGAAGRPGQASGAPESGASSGAGVAPSGGASDGAGRGSNGEGAVTGGPAGPGRQKKRRSTAVPLTLAVIVLLVVIGLIVGIFLRPGQESAPQVQDPATAPPETASEGEGQDTGTASVPPAIASAEALDPQGDGAENNADVDNVLPGVSGVWQTDNYNSAAFGGLKDGLGIVLELEEEGTINAVDLISGSPGGQIEIRVGDSADPEEAEVVGRGSLPDDTGSFDLDEPATGTHVFVWITELPETEDGFRARISEIGLS
ncbi:hypothetical protein GCM10022261_00810 [Brevibacterium daeguense]|uniref:Protein kinase domain-containing protein n=2 Tax=Brevibacterium daeguense TaxID=909936 RepID=A0ABP8EF21_9MICO